MPPGRGRGAEGERAVPRSCPGAPRALGSGLNTPGEAHTQSGSARRRGSKHEPEGASARNVCAKAGAGGCVSLQCGESSCSSPPRPALGYRRVLGFGLLSPGQEGDGGILGVLVPVREIGPFAQLEEDGQVPAAHVHGARVHQEEGLGRVVHQLLPCGGGHAQWGHATPHGDKRGERDTVWLLGAPALSTPHHGAAQRSGKPRISPSPGMAGGSSVTRGTAPRGAHGSHSPPRPAPHGKNTFSGVLMEFDGFSFPSQNTRLAPLRRPAQGFAAPPNAPFSSLNVPSLPAKPAFWEGKRFGRGPNPRAAAAGPSPRVPVSAAPGSVSAGFCCSWDERRSWICGREVAVLSAAPGPLGTDPARAARSKPWFTAPTGDLQPQTVIYGAGTG